MLTLKSRETRRSEATPITRAQRNLHNEARRDEQKGLAALPSEASVKGKRVLLPASLSEEERIRRICLKRGKAARKYCTELALPKKDSRG